MKALLLVLLLAAFPAQAHKLKLFVAAEGDAVVGTAYFFGGGKAAGIPGRILAPDGAVLAELRTGEDGSFRFEMAGRAGQTVVFDSGDGHVASAAVGPDGLAPALPESPGASATKEADAAVAALVEAAVARQIRPLRQQIEAYESRARLGDIIGGIGGIFGLFGIAAWLAARRRSP